jgi:hypothetical protein
MFFELYDDSDLVVSQVVAALDLVLNELCTQKSEHEKSAELSDTIEGVLKSHGDANRIRAEYGFVAEPMDRNELHSSLAMVRNHTDIKSGAYEKTISEIQLLKYQVEAKDVLSDASDKILAILMAGLARSSSRILNCMEFAPNNVLEQMQYMYVYARAINSGFEADVELQYPFMD